MLDGRPEMQQQVRPSIFFTLNRIGGKAPVLAFAVSYPAFIGLSGK
ncbi:MAG: hypothetical protein ACJA1T_000781 [Zhongshania aliphaticivorans]|jgi:hypothetical protein